MVNLSCLIEKMAPDILLFTCAICFLQVKHSSIWIPISFVEDSRQLLPILSNGRDMYLITTVLCKYKSAPRVIDIRAASFRHPRREFRYPRREFDIRAASFRSAPRVWGPRREFKVRAASFKHPRREFPRRKHPRREFQTSAPRVSNIRAASFKHPRREFQTSAPRVSNIRAATFWR